MRLGTGGFGHRSPTPPVQLMRFPMLIPAALIGSLLVGAAAEAKTTTPVCSASSDVYTQATLLPTAHVIGTQDMCWSSIVVGQKPSIFCMDLNGRRTRLSGDACLIGPEGTPAKFTVTGVDKDGVHVYVSATELVGQYNPKPTKLQLWYLVAYPTNAPKGKPKGLYDLDYTVTGKLTLPAGAAPDLYKGTMTLTVQYL